MTLTERQVAPRVARSRSIALWFVVLAAVFVAWFVVIDKVFVQTSRGQRIDDAGLAGSVIGRAHIINEVTRILDLVSVTGLVIAVLVVGVIGMARRRPGLAAMSIALLAGTNISTHLLKDNLLTRPNLGIDHTAGFARNTLPSGHTTVAISVSVALLIVVSPAARAPVAFIGALASAGMGVATLSAGWHRPSDAMAAYLVVGAWAAGLAAIYAVLLGVRRGRRAVPAASATLIALLGAAGLGAGIIALHHVGVVPDATGRRHLFLAYAGGSAAVAGTALLTMAVLLLVMSLLDPPGATKASERRPG
jgi:hypothetical protein